MQVEAMRSGIKALYDIVQVSELIKQFNKKYAMEVIDSEGSRLCFGKSNKHILSRDKYVH
jgi:hypothetical protein